MKNLSLLILFLLFIPTVMFGQESELSGFNNFTKWVDKKKDNLVSPKELEDLDEFKLNKNGNFSFIIYLPRNKKLVTTKKNRVSDQEYTITAKDNETGTEWTVFKSKIEYGKIDWLELKPIAGNITLTCTFSEVENEHQLTYTHSPPVKQYNQHLNYYLDSLMIEPLSNLSDEKKNIFKEGKTVRISAIQNYDYLQNYRLPYYRIAKSLIEYSGLETITDDNVEADLELIINGNGTSVKGKSNIKDYRGNLTDVPTRPILGINGTVILKSKDRANYAQRFNWTKKLYPLEFVRKEGSFGMMHSTKQITAGYNDIFYHNSYLEVISKLLINTLDINPVDLYVHMSNDKANGVFFEAIKLLGELKDTAAFDEIERIYNDESIYKQRAATYALAQLEYPSARLKLLDAIKSQDYHIKRFAVDGLSVYKDKEVVDAFILALNDKNVAIAQKVASVLGRIGDNSAFNALISKLSMPNNFHNNNVARSCITALGDLGNTNAIGSLIPLLKKSRFKKKAGEALNKLTDQDFGENYKLWSNWWEKNKSAFLN